LCICGRFAGAVHDKLDGVLTRSRSVSLRRTSVETADSAVLENRENVAPKTQDPKSPSALIESFRKKMQELKITTASSIKRRHAAPAAAATSSKVLGSRASRMNAEQVAAGTTEADDGMVEVDLQGDENEAELSFPSTIYSPEQQQDVKIRDQALRGIPEE
jgi:translation initiation factor 1 (eIF-1/SUI1)